MASFFSGLSPVSQALVASLFTWGVTALGAALVFLTRSVNRRVLDLSLGFTAGVMIAASFWSLLAPLIALAEEIGLIPWLPAGVGFLLGGALLAIAITLHNIPEGLASGVSFGAAAARVPDATPGAAIALAIGIGLQNFAEGTALSLPLRAEGLSRARAWWYGQLSAAVEPVAAVLGCAIKNSHGNPYAMGWS